MTHKCIICGRMLEKTIGLIGPTCAKKHGNKIRGFKKVMPSMDDCQQDIFAEENNGSKKISPTSTSS